MYNVKSPCLQININHTGIRTPALPDICTFIIFYFEYFDLVAFKAYKNC